MSFLIKLKHKKATLLGVAKDKENTYLTKLFLKQLGMFSNGDCTS